MNPILLSRMRCTASVTAGAVAWLNIEKALLPHAILIGGAAD
jgi:hypothetical protein